MLLPCFYNIIKLWHISTTVLIQYYFVTYNLSSKCNKKYIKLIIFIEICLAHSVILEGWYSIILMIFIFINILHTWKILVNKIIILHSFPL